MNVPDRIAKLALHILTGIAAQKLQIFIHRARNDIEIKTLRLARLLIHEQRKRFRAGIGQPIFDRQAIALRLGNLLTLFIEEEFVIETFRRNAAQRANNVGRELHRVDEILARHFVIDLERIPAHGPVRLPLQLHMSAGDGRLIDLARIRIAPGDRARLHIARFQRHLHDDTRFRMHGQERRIGRGTLFAQ